MSKVLIGRKTQDWTKNFYFLWDLLLWHFLSRRSFFFELLTWAKNFVKWFWELNDLFDSELNFINRKNLPWSLILMNLGFCLFCFFVFSLFSSRKLFENKMNFIIQISFIVSSSIWKQTKYSNWNLFSELNSKKSLPFRVQLLASESVVSKWWKNIALLWANSEKDFQVFLIYFEKRLSAAWDLAFQYGIS